MAGPQCSPKISHSSPSLARATYCEQEGILLSPTIGSSAFNRVLSALHSPCKALITPQAVAFDACSGRPIVGPQHVQDATPLADKFSVAVGDLLSLIDQTKVRRRRLQVAVSDYWARPAILILPATPHSDEAIDTLLASHYRRFYGELMNGWRWCWSQHDARLTAVAWPADALDILQAGLAQRGCVLSSAKSLGLLLGAQLSKLPGAYWLVILERTHVTLMRLQNGALRDWCVVSGMADTASLAAQLPLQLARESARSGDNCRALVIINFDAATDLSPVCKNLLNAGWSSRVCAAAELSSSWVWRLQQLTCLSKTT